MGGKRSNLYDDDRSDDANPPPSLFDAEVQPSTTRPSWTAAEKLAILAEYESYPRGAPERGALLRCQGIYTSHISKWRSQRNRGTLVALNAQPRGPKSAPPDPLTDEVARLQARLDQAAIVIDIQKSCAAAWGAAPDLRCGRLVMWAGVETLAPLVEHKRSQVYE